MLVFLVLSRICEGHEDLPSSKRYWRPLNSKRSLPVLKWTSENESFKKKFADTYNPVQEQSLDPSLRMRVAG